VLLGADPEFFLLKEGKIIPASDAGLGNGKEDPAARLRMSEAIVLYRDGYAAEVNFIHAYNCRGTMGNALRAGVMAFLRNTGLSASTLPSIEVPLPSLLSLPVDVATFGCSPSLNAWEDGPCEIDVDGLTHPFRYSGGHLWFSALKRDWWWTSHIRESVKLLDLFLGAPFSWMFARPEHFRRRCLYGKAGEYRVKDFHEGNYQGLEYRTLSAEWMNHAVFFSFVFGVGRHVLQNAPHLWRDFQPFLEKEGDLLQQAINTGEGLDKLVEKTRLLPFYTFSTLESVREKTEYGQRRFEFRLDDVSDFHLGWFTTLNKAGIEEAA